MGRVSRYKKIKAFDPYSKQNGGKINLDTVGIWGMSGDGRKVKKHSKTVGKIKARGDRLRREEKRDPNDRAYNAPLHAKDDFDMADLVGSLKKEKPIVLEDEPVPIKELKKTTIPSKSVLHIDPIEEHANRLLKLDAQVEPKKKVVKTEQGRMEGESKNAYKKRTKEDVRQIIKREHLEEHNPEKKQRKKDFLNNKKKNKKGKKASYVEEDDDDDDQSVEDGNDKFITGEQAVAARARATEVRFGEQAERPPTFRTIPRGAVRKSELKFQSSDKKMNEKDITAEQKSMELMRLKVQAQYRLIKAQRQQNR
jgi:hypothetical protein